MPATEPRPVLRIRDGRAVPVDDVVAVEAPVELRVEHGPASARRTASIGLTMRTPGEDADLVVGFLVAEGVLRRPDDLLGVDVDVESACARVAPGVAVDLSLLQRHGTATSACGLCGRASLDAVAARGAPRLPAGPRLGPEVIVGLPDRLRTAQAAFAATGGLHAAGLFGADGALRVAREDVGRHNAVDKVFGAALRAGAWPPGEAVLQVSGRASFELVQKAVMAGVPWLSAVGAPSSLAIELALAHGLTLVGFVRDGGFVVYSGAGRVAC